MTYFQTLTIDTLSYALAFGYIFGSIPFGLVLCRIFGYGDIRKIGSGNIGATNVLRTGNKFLAFLTLLLDSGKGAIAVLLVTYFLNFEAAILAGIAAVIGHNFPVWLKFKGGKGVATTLGTLIALSWPVGLAAIGTWLVSALIFRISSLSALIALAASPLYSYYLSTVEVAFATAFLAALAWVRHHENIKRIINGQEPKIGKKEK